MSDERLSTTLLRRDASARDGAMRGLLSALWSFLHHPVVAVEETVAGAEQRLEEDLKRAIRGRVAGIQARLEIVQARVVEDLKHELRRVVLILALAVGCAVLALVGTTFGLMAVWTDLKGSIGSVGASLALAITFLVASLVVFGTLRSVLRGSQSRPSTGTTAS